MSYRKHGFIQTWLDAGGPRGQFNFGNNQTSTSGATVQAQVNGIASFLVDSPSSIQRDLAVQLRHDLRSARNRQATGRIREIVLHVDHEQRGLRVIGGHGRYLATVRSHAVFSRSARSIDSASKSTRDA